MKLTEIFECLEQAVGVDTDISPDIWGAIATLHDVIARSRKLGMMLERFGDLPKRPVDIDQEEFICIPYTQFTAWDIARSAILKGCTDPGYDLAVKYLQEGDKSK